MLGFLVNYQTTGATNPSAIMETYSPEQLPVLSGLARNYAVSDAWFASAPCQTWPNRAFFHTGTSNGRINNAPNNPFDYDIPTIFNVLEANRNSWAVYNPGPFISLTRLQFPRLYDPGLQSHFRSITDFVNQAKTGELPSYSFVEPSFMALQQGADDQHPPHDVCLGEQFLLEIYSALANGKNWEQTLLVITYDEHGGCPDHVPPPWGVASPDQVSNPGQEGFRFDRFGVPRAARPGFTLDPGRNSLPFDDDVPYDHTSILATLRDWLAIPETLMLPSRRVAAAPTLDGVLNLATVAYGPAHDHLHMHSKRSPAQRPASTQFASAWHGRGAGAQAGRPEGRRPSGPESPRNPAYHRGRGPVPLRQPSSALADTQPNQAFQTRSGKRCSAIERRTCRLLRLTLTAWPDSGSWYSSTKSVR